MSRKRIAKTRPREEERLAVLTPSLYVGAGREETHGPQPPLLPARRARARRSAAPPRALGPGARAGALRRAPRAARFRGRPAAALLAPRLRSGRGRAGRGAGLRLDRPARAPRAAGAGRGRRAARGPALR